MSYSSNDAIEIIKVLLAIKNDTEREKTKETIKKGHRELLKASVNSRRIKSREIINELFEIDMALKELEINYKILKEENSISEIEALNNYIIDVKKYRKKLADEKRRI